MPTSPIQSEQEISENVIDSNEFDKELPFESEYYRTSTDRDEFVRPIPNADGNEIDDGEDGIDLDEQGTWIHTPDCTYHIDIKLFYESIDALNIKLDGLTVKSGSKNNLTLSEFVQQAQAQIFNTIKGKNLTNELVNDVIGYLRQTFVSAFGYEDNCGVSTTVTTFFSKNQTQVDSPNVFEEVTDVTTDDEGVQNETEVSDTETGTSSDEEVTEEYQPRVLTRPKLSDVVQDVINVYKALNNWNYSELS